MRFIARPEVFAMIPGVRIVVVVAHGLDNATPRPAIAEAWREAW